MGQYYKVIFLGEEGLDENEIIRFYLEPLHYNNGMKIEEHFYLHNNYVSTVEFLLTINGMFYKSRMVWAGDYAEKEDNSENNLYEMANKFPDKNFYFQSKNVIEWYFLVNHTKRIFVDKRKQKNIHPLPLLTSEGFDTKYYEGKNVNLIGSWARDIISVEKEAPVNYKELDCVFNLE